MLQNLLQTLLWNLRREPAPELAPEPAEVKTP